MSYWSEYRAAHPEYRERERERGRRRRATGVRGDRTAEYARRSARRRVVETSAVMTHPLLDAARAYVGDRPPGAYFRWTRELDDEDATSEAVLAMLEGCDPRQAVKVYRSAASAWRRVTGHYDETVR